MKTSGIIVLVLGCVLLIATVRTQWPLDPWKFNQFAVPLGAALTCLSAAILNVIANSRLERQKLENTKEVTRLTAELNAANARASSLTTEQDKALRTLHEAAMEAMAVLGPMEIGTIHLSEWEAADKMMRLAARVKDSAPTDYCEEWTAFRQNSSDLIAYLKDDVGKAGELDQKTAIISIWNYDGRGHEIVKNVTKLRQIFRQRFAVENEPASNSGN
ncbi:MAG TPA: hypothetical protein VIT91_03450 [Chthoniobacterales bacterium]